MSILFKLILVAVISLYIIFMSFFVYRKIIQAKTMKKIDANIEKEVKPKQAKEIKMLGIERRLINYLKIQDKVVGKFLLLERLSAITLLVMSSFVLGVIPIFVMAILIGSFIFEELLNDVIEQTGIKYIENTNEFLDSYIPSISSGLSNDQAILKFIETHNDEDLFNWWVNKENGAQIPKKWEKIAEIYEVMLFNESKGMDNSISIIEEMQKDLDSKQKFYNDYLSRINEVKPIELSYYFGVPLILIMTFNETRDWWFGLGGIICGIIITAFFMLFKFLMFKVKKNTINTMF